MRKSPSTQAVVEQVAVDKPKFSEIELKEKFKKLVDVLSHNGDKTKMKVQIDEFVFTESLEPLDCLHYLSNELNQYRYGEQADIPGVCYSASMDWKAGVEDLNWFINSAFGGQKIPNLPTDNDYPEFATISHDGLWEDYNHALHASNLTLRILEEDSDNYQLVFHVLTNSDEVESLLLSLDINSVIPKR